VPLEEFTMRRVAFMAALYTVATALAIDAQCACTGNSPAQKYEGGDGTPLRWYSLQRLIRPGTSHSDPVHCYERQVTNDSSRDVTDVYWRVAGFERPLIEAGAPVCDATSMLGHLEQPHVKGPLNHGVGTRAYGTTVYAPAGGWGRQMALVNGREPPPLEATIQIPIRGKETTTLEFRSTVVSDGSGYVYRYEMANKGQNEVRVFWNVPITSEFASLEFIPGSPIVMAAKSSVARQARSADKLAWAVAEVHVYSADLTWLGTGSAAAYASSLGKPQVALPRGRGVAY
jgi:hypothetical protein